MIKSDGDLRMLGTRDGLAHAMIQVRQAIGRINGQYSPRIDPRHVRKLAAREAVLRPLQDLNLWLTCQHMAVMEAYEKSRTP